MVVKLFVLGRPGSGKTTAFRCIKELLEPEGWSVIRVRDYDILQEMFRNDAEQKRFRRIAHGGFDVIDFSVLDEALMRLEEQVKTITYNAKEKELIMIEFARDDYRNTLKPFSPNFRSETHTLFIEADMEICIQRIKKRVIKGRASDNHYVSEYILREYYGHNNIPYMLEQVELNMRVRSMQPTSEKVVHFIDNNDSLTNFHNKIEDFAILLKEHEILFAVRELEKIH